MLIDTHAHIYLKEFDADRLSVLERAQSAGVRKILLPNIDATSIDDMLRLTTQFPELCLPMMGLHPCSVNASFKDEISQVEHNLAGGGFVAVGEIGTDLYWDKTFWEEQKKAFLRQCELGLSYNLPVVIHCRETIDETIELVRPFANRGLSGVFHCFTGNLSQATEIRKMGFYLGIGGVSTFKNGGLKDILPELGLDRIVLETDSPYLAPVPYRGKRNEPAYVKVVNSNLAEVLGFDEEKVAETTTQNALELFRIDEL